MTETMRTILIVDDDDTVRESLADFFEDALAHRCTPEQAMVFQFCFSLAV